MTVTALFDTTSRPAHPAKYTDALLPIMAGMLKDCAAILDPFGGTGKIFQLGAWLPTARIEAVEIETEWAAMHPRTTLGNALHLPWAACTFDAICTSPTYGNRMADHHAAQDTSKRLTYRHTLGRPLHADNAGALQWGDGYRQFHVAAWTEARRVLRPGAAFVLNCKDHFRAGVLQPVTDWHISALSALGFYVVRHERIETPGMRYGRNGGKRIAYESVVLLVFGRVQ